MGDLRIDIMRQERQARKGQRNINYYLSKIRISGEFENFSMRRGNIARAKHFSET